jgi:hypothetical protein
MLPQGSQTGSWQKQDIAKFLLSMIQWIALASDTSRVSSFLPTTKFDMLPAGTFKKKGLHLYLQAQVEGGRRTQGLWLLHIIQIPTSAQHWTIFTSV